jgi:hypothetical protein
MVSISQSIDTYLRADATLMNLIGGISAPTKTTGRLYDKVALDLCSLPYVVYTLVSDTDVIEHFGTQDAGQGRVQIDCVATTKASAITIEQRVRTLLRYNHGTLGGLSIWTIEPAGRREVYNSDTSRYVYSADYIIHCEY